MNNKNTSIRYDNANRSKDILGRVFSAYVAALAPFREGTDLFSEPVLDLLDFLVEL